METLIAQLKAIAPMSPGLEAYLRLILRRKKFLADEIILQEGQICQHISFIESGMIRIYRLTGNKEVTIWLLKELDIFISVNSFFTQTPSFHVIQAIENVVVWCITYAELEEACRKFPEFNVHRDKIKEKYYLISEQVKDNNLSLSPEKRYAQLIETDSDILNRAPLKYIPSYLGISQSTFERVRRNYKG